MFGRTAVIVASRPDAAWNSSRRAEVDVGHAVGVGRAEAILCLTVDAASLSSASGRGVDAGIEALDLDSLGPALSRLTNSATISPR